MMEYENVVIKCLEELRHLALKPNPFEWDVVDYQIYLGAHNLRLFCAFSDEARSTIDEWKLYVIARLNIFIMLRNTMLSSACPTFSGEFGKNGPLGILLYLANIPDCACCYNDDGTQELHETFGVKSHCASCKRLCEPVVLSALCDVHAPWKCRACGCFDIIVKDSKDMMRLRQAMSSKKMRTQKHPTHIGGKAV